MKGHKVR